MAKPNNKTQNHRCRMATGIGCERNTTIKPNTRCLTTSNMKTQPANHNRMSYRQSNNPFIGPWNFLRLPEKVISRWIVLRWRETSNSLFFPLST
ncbi:hypothetical protein L873DRAFT_762856 [Choiromyces venosus 120613-1]|uniref:Uncharacterized protein n=1 Tax=Choiromyces venosus 120613-1 TaxID=1336337 RepID=A0A3N4JX50_9PEZI|nr:hypothetical protein L873DRAFT_762856 [Choiromyces venosus 120613-1]